MKKLLYAVVTAVSLTTYMLAMDAPAQKVNEESLIAAIKAGNIDLLEDYFLEGGKIATLNISGKATPLIDAIMILAPNTKKKINFLNLLLIHTNYVSDLTPLLKQAADEGDIELAQWLVSIGIPDPKGEKQRAIQVNRAALKPTEEKYKKDFQLTDAPAQKVSEESLIAAIKAGNIDLLEDYFLEGGKISTLNISGKATPLIDAIMILAPNAKKKINFLNLLLIHTNYVSDLTPLLKQATDEGDIELAKWLVSIGIPDPKDEKQRAIQVNRAK